MTIGSLVNELENRLEADGTIDSITLIESTNVINKAVGIIFALLTWGIIVILPILICIEIIYISFPVIRDKTNEFLLKLEQRGHKHNLPGFILRDAKRAVEEAEEAVAKNTGTGTGTSSALWIYLRIKLPAVFFTFFVVAFALQGTAEIVDFISNLFVGFFESLGIF